MAEWESVHLNHKDKALHGFYAYQVAEGGALKVMKNGREVTDKQVHDFIKIIIPFAKELREKASAAKPAGASGAEQDPTRNPKVTPGAPEEGKP